MPSACQTDLLANVFDALPLPALVVDSDVRIIEFNLAAAKILQDVPFSVIRPTAGYTLHCFHSAGDVEGCGHAGACHDCVIRNSVRDVLAGAKPGRKIARMSLIRDGQPVDVNFLVTAAPVPDEPEPLALLILDDAAELSALLSPASSSPGSKAREKAHAHKTGNS